MGRILVKNAVKRERGSLYYVDGNGNVCETRMKQYKANKNTSRSMDGVPKKRKKKATKKRVAKKKKK